MSTRSLIGYYNKADGSVTATYCHWDGYVECNGATLEEHYATDADACAISSAGYISCLRDTVDRSIIDAPNKSAPLQYESVEDYMNMAVEEGAEYVYLWDGSAWFVSEQYADDTRFTDVATVLAENA